MAITSTNINPRNESRYARHRSISKGKENRLVMTVNSLRETRGIKVYEHVGTPGVVTTALFDTWGITTHATRRPPKPGQVLGQWEVGSPTPQMKRAMPVRLHADLRLIWEDFILVTARRIGISTGAGSSSDEDASNYHGDSLVLFAIGATSFDFIVSKYGYGLNNKRNHHFFHWQSRLTGFDGLVHVDDYNDETV